MNHKQCANKHSKLCTMTMCLINAHSVKNKAPQLIEYIIEHGFDIMAITETWLHNTYEIYASCCELGRLSFCILHFELCYMLIMVQGSSLNSVLFAPKLHKETYR